MPTNNDLIGYLASAFVLLAFYQKDMMTLRIAAILSNIAFLVYAARLQLMPIVVLHGLLLPINIMRLAPLLHQFQVRCFGYAVGGEKLGAAPAHDQKAQKVIRSGDAPTHPTC